MPLALADGAYDEEGVYVYRKDTYDFPMGKDPMNISDEDFFGEWDPEEGIWIRESLLNYEKFPALADVENAAKIGDYEMAKQALMDYYVPQKANKCGIGSPATATQLLEAELEARNFYSVAFQNGVSRAIAEIPSDWTDISVDVTDSINQALVDGQLYRTFVIASIDKSNSYSEIMSKESGVAPTLTLIVNNVVKEFTVYEDSYMRAGMYAGRNFGDEESMYVQEYGYVGHWDSAVNPWTTDASDTRRAYIKFDLSSLNKSDNITGAVLNFRARTVGGDLDEKEVVVYEWQDSNWSEKGLTWNTFTDWLMLSCNEQDTWDYITGNNPAKKGKMCYYHRGNQQICLSSSYMYTNDDKYAYTFLRQGMGLIRNVGVNRDVMNCLDMSGYVRRIGDGFIKCWGSNALTPDVFTAFLKEFYEMTEVIAEIWIETETYSNNWGSYATLATYHMAAIYPEFKRADYWYELTVKDNYRLNSGFSLEDGSCIELGQGYVRTLLGTLSSPLSIYSVTNTPYGMPYNDIAIDQTYKIVKSLYHQMAPGYKGFNMGDSMDANVTTEVTSVLETWYKYFLQFGIDDEELKYVVTKGKDGKLPDFTSISYPNGLRTFMRSDWSEDALSLAFTAKGEGSHGHHDTLSVAMYAYGQFLLTDQSYGSTLTGEIRNTMIAAKTHNTITVNGGNILYGAGKDGFEKEQEINDLYNMTTYGASTVEGADNVERTVTFLKNQKFWIISDYVVPSNTSTQNVYTQFWHMLPSANIYISDDNEFRSNFSSGANVIVSGVDTDSMSGIYLDYTVYSPTDGSFIDTKKGVYERKSNGNVTYGTIIYPMLQGDDFEIVSQVIDTGISDNGAIAFNFRITDKGTEDFDNYYYYHINDLEQKKSVSIGKYETDATSMLVQESDTGSIMSVFLYDATYLKSSALTDKYVFKSESGEKTLGIDFNSGNIISVSTDDFDSDGLTDTAFYTGFDVDGVAFNGSLLSNAKKDGTYLYFGEESIVECTETKPGTPDSENDNKHTSTTPGGGGSGTVSPGAGSGTGIGGGTVVIPPDTDNAISTNNSFNDMTKDMWSYDAVEKLREKGIVSGDENGCFNPENNIKREEFLKMLMNALEIDVQDDLENTFDDVEEDAWYKNYVLTSKKLGIINGIADNMFGVSNNITRQDMSVMISRILESMGTTLDDSSEMFTDNGNISDYAVSSVYKMKNLGIIKGYDNMFYPKNNLTRAEAASVISGLLDYLDSIDTEKTETTETEE